MFKNAFLNNLIDFFLFLNPNINLNPKIFYVSMLKVSNI